MDDGIHVQAFRTASKLRLALAEGYAPLTPTDEDALHKWRALKFSTEGEGKFIETVPLEVVYRAMLAYGDRVLKEAGVERS